MKIIFTKSFNDSCERIGWAKVTGWTLKKIYWRLIPYYWRPGNILYRLKNLLWVHPNTVKARTLPSTQWTDKDELLLHCCFELLVRFIDEECSPGIVDWDAGEFDRKAFATMKELYNWWKDDYPDLDQFSISDQRLIQKQLHRLVNIRRFMWT